MEIFKEDLPVIPSEAALIHSRIESYMDQDLFFLVIQPTVDFQTGCAYTGEALTRLNHPEYGILSADLFLPTLEAMGLCSGFDLYIFRKCCIWLYRAAESGKRFDNLSCNFSRKTLSQAGVAGELIRIADSYAVPFHKLGIEITEWQQETDLHQITENLRQLKTAGFRIILDDYGSGVTSEKDLYYFPLDMVKLDQSLLQNLNTETGNREFRALVNAFLRLGMKVICEGIETEFQDRLVRETGCHYGQGFLYYKPVFPEMVFEMIS